MEKLNKISYISILLFVIGFAFKMLHFPGAGALMLLSVLFSFVMLLVKVVKLNKHELFKENLILHSTFFLALTYVVLRMMFLGFSQMVFPVLLLASIITIVVLFSKKYKQSLEWIFVFGFMIFAFAIFPFRAYQIYGFTNESRIEKSAQNNVDDQDRVPNANIVYKYAWFLNTAKEYSQSEEQLDIAIRLLEEGSEEINKESALFGKTKEEMLEKKSLLRKREWNSF
jgi:hypothetical protein